MAKIDFLHICERTELSSDGRPSIINITEVLWIPPGGVTFPRLVEAMQWRGAPGERVSYSLDVRDAVGGVVATTQQEVVLGTTVTPKRAKAFREVAVTDVTFEAVGVYTIVVGVGDQVLAWTPLEVLDVQR